MAAPYPGRWRALAVCLSALSMTLLDLSIANVALPAIRADQGASVAQGQWVISGYALAIGMVPIIAGQLGDTRGRRRMLLLGIVGFVLTSALVGFSPGVGVLLVARFVQGLAGGLINPQISGITQAMFPTHERGRAFGAIGATVGICTATGPVLGGALVHFGGSHWGWRLCFLINVPIGLVALILCWSWIPKPTERPRPARLDLTGVALLTVALFCVLFPAVQFDASRNLLLLVFLAPAVVATVGFVRWERGPALRRGPPLIDLGLFRIRSFSSGLTVGLLFFCAFNGMSLVLALFLQDGLGLSALLAGSVVAIYAAGATGGSFISGRLVSRVGPRILVVSLLAFTASAAAAGAIGAGLAGHVSTSVLVAALALPLLIAGFGGGGCVSPNQTLALADLGDRGGSLAGGVLQSAQRVGNAIGAAVISTGYYLVIAGHGQSRGSARASDFGHAYGVGLAITAAFGAAALAAAVITSARERRAADSVAAVG